MLFRSGYWSLANWIKDQVPDARRYIVRFERAAAAAALKRGLDGVICGHIHHPGARQVEGVHYCNDGDWVENCSMLYEDSSGHLRVGFHHMKANAGDVLLGSIPRGSAGVTFDKAA